MKKLVAGILLVAAMNASAYCVTGFLKRSYTKTVAGNHVQVCVYGVNGDEIEVIQSAFKLCPLNQDFCF